MKRIETAEAIAGLWRSHSDDHVNVALGFTELGAEAMEVQLIAVQGAGDVPVATGGVNQHWQDDFSLTWLILDRRDHDTPDDAYTAGGLWLGSLVDVLLRSDRLTEDVPGLWFVAPAEADGPNLFTHDGGYGTVSELTVGCRHRVIGGVQ